MSGPPDTPLRDRDYERLLAFRTELRDFLRWSERAAHGMGLTPALHQLLLAVRGHPVKHPPSIADVAQQLHMRHHSAVELSQRAEAGGLLERNRDPVDSRSIHLRLTRRGQDQLEALTREHLTRIQALARALAGATRASPSESDRTSG
jgi:DNA-binding MarR family transcriptional regulator